MGKSVIIIGGGLAGLASAVFLSSKGFDVSLYESSPKWGGRTYSYFDNEKRIYLDNGQHILTGWYDNTFEYLKLIGTHDKLKFKKELNLLFFDKRKNMYNLKGGNLPGVYSLLLGIFRFKGFNLYDKLKFLKVRNIINNKFSVDYLKMNCAEKLLNVLEQTDNLKKYFWNPLIFASFNTIPEKVSAELFVKLVKKGTEFKKNMSIILSDANLNELFINGAIDYLKNKSVKMELGSGVKKVYLEDKKIQNIEMESGKIEKADYYVSAVPYYSFSKLFDKDKYSQYFCNIEKLKSSTIISVHLFFKEDLNLDIQNDMIGLIDTVVQWVFVKNKRHLCLVISGSDFIENNLTAKENDEIVKICLNDLKSCLNGFDENNFLDYKVIKEKRATFIPEVGSENFRIKQKCDIDNLFVGGDWTDTGYPATIEGAIKSAKICSDLILNKIN